MITRTLIVLSDGETYDDADGCRLIVVTQEVYDQIASGQVKPNRATCLAQTRFDGDVWAVPNALAKHPTT